ncbi:hypothetical protein FOMA001_g17483 [Fusarium oxysporum f. sp. matthiolae]|nr:hypothetical protein FOMA001_g17483 [Fusarium oxysporum f. sp. matthiolae]
MHGYSSSEESDDPHRPCAEPADNNNSNDKKKNKEEEAPAPKVHQPNMEEVLQVQVPQGTRCPTLRLCATSCHLPLERTPIGWI